MANLVHRGIAAGLAPPAVVDARQILDSIESPMLVVGADLTVHYSNRPARRDFAGGATLAELLAEARILGDARSWAEEVALTLELGAPRRIEFILPGKAGAHASLFAGRFTRFAGGDGTGQVVLQLERREVTDAAQEQLELTHRLASLGRMAAGVAHELNNPLDGVLRYVNLALRTLDRTDRSRLESYLVASRDGLCRMTRIIGDLLAFSRTTEGAFDAVPIAEVIAKAIEAHADDARRLGVVIAADYQSPRLPCVRGGRLYQVLGNLIRNALDAMPNGGRVTLTSGLVADDVVITVSDTGVGLRDPIEQLFQPFYTTKARGDGTGLGLALCRDFMKGMGGTINARHGDDGGAAFTLRLPVSRCVVRSDCRSNETPSGGAPSAGGNPP